MWYKSYDANWLWKAPDDFLDANEFTKCMAIPEGVFVAYAISLKRLFETGGFYAREFHSLKIPYLDHGIIYKNPKNKKMCLVFQPYYPVEMIKDRIQKWADSEGLQAVLTENHWYNKSTCEVFIFLKDAEIIIPGYSYK